VAWVPLVDAYRTKCMYILDRANTKKALALLDEGKDNWAEYEAFCVKHGDNPEIPFGSALFFWTGLLHGSKINAEAETRWTLNMRYKNLFSPNGEKDPFDFFKVLSLSPLAKLGLDFQKRNLLG
jgi:sporadic carbohydrate cluster 2OG-Fe(II) oxygenase